MVQMEGMERLVQTQLHKIKRAPCLAQELPQLVDGGETGAGEALEEDFDLSDIMGQEFGAGGLSSKEARLQEIEAQLQVWQP